MIHTLLTTIALGYLTGCFQTAYILVRLLKKKDIRDFGFGNAGASNTVASFGWKLGAAVAILDILKPMLSVFVLRRLISLGLIESYPFLTMLSGLFVILGHNYPFYLKFRGGKGTASLFGIMATISFPYALVGAVVFVITSLITDYVAMGTFSLLIYFVGLSIFLDMDFVSVLIAILIALQSSYLHLQNVRRIFDGTETKVSSKYKK